MAIIGTFMQVGEDFIGAISTLVLNAKIEIMAVPKTHDRAPDFRVYAADIEIGAAWSATGKSGRSYLSLRLDDPSFAGPIHCRLIGLDDDSQTLVWSR